MLKVLESAVSRARTNLTLPWFSIKKKFIGSPDASVIARSPKKPVSGSLALMWKITLEIRVDSSTMTVIGRFSNAGGPILTRSIITAT